MIDIRPSPAPEETRKAVLELLDGESVAKGHPFDVDEIVFEACEGDRVVGGLSAKLAMDMLYVELLAVRPEFRGKGIARRLLAAAEAEARARGAVAVFLDTFEFQAPALYPRLGYVRFGEIAGRTPERTRYFYQKRLD